MKADLNTRTADNKRKSYYRGRPPARREVAQDKKQKIFEGLRRGMSINKIASSAGVTKTTVSYVRDYGVDTDD